MYFKLWVTSDPTGYTLDFNVYTGKSENHGQHGLAYGVVQELIAPYIFQRYFLFFDNFYSSTKLLDDLYKQEVYATGTFRIDRCGIPDDVKIIKVTLSGSKIARELGTTFGSLETLCHKSLIPVGEIPVQYVPCQQHIQGMP